MPTHNVVVLGGAYAGAHAYQLLANGLGKDFRVIMIDRNTHANHLYTFARYAVLPGHEHKAFIPYKGIFHPVKASDPDPPPSPHHVILHAKIIDLKPHEVTIDRTYPELGFDSPVIPFNYAVYALGNHLPAAIDFWSRSENAIVKQPETHPNNSESDDAVAETRKEYDGTKQEGIDCFRHCQERIHEANGVLCVGGGALGIQFATDVKSVYPEKNVTLLHSRQQLLPRFDYELHSEVLKSIEDLGINLILGERLDLTSTRSENAKFNERGQRVVRTEKGREIAADLILLCTGQLPNTDLLAKMSPQSVDPKTKLAFVLPTMQLGIIPSATESGARDVAEQAEALPSEPDIKQLRLDEKSASHESEHDDAQADLGHSDKPTLEKIPETPYPHIFVAGDCADAFGAIKAGHTAFWQAEVVSRNIIRLAQREAQSDGNKKNDVGSEEGKEGESDGQIESLELESYTPGLPAIKVSLGVGSKSAYQINGMVGRKETPETDDLDAPFAWALFGIQDARPEDMFL